MHRATRHDPVGASASWRIRSPHSSRASRRSPTLVPSAIPLVLGAHLEGPFLSPVKNRGAHEPGYLVDPGPAAVDALLDGSRGTLRQITIAPELPDALDAIEVSSTRASSSPSGTREADDERSRDGVRPRRDVLTHAFNAMPGIHHRAPGPIVAAFDDAAGHARADPRRRARAPDGRPLAVRAGPRSRRARHRRDGGRGGVRRRLPARLARRDGDVEGEAMLSGTKTLAGSTLTQDAALRTRDRSREDRSRARRARAHGESGPCARARRAARATCAPATPPTRCCSLATGCRRRSSRTGCARSDWRTIRGRDARIGAPPPQGGGTPIRFELEADSACDYARRAARFSSSVARNSSVVCHFWSGPTSSARSFVILPALDRLDDDILEGRRRSR